MSYEIAAGFFGALGSLSSKAAFLDGFDFVKKSLFMNQDSPI